MNIGQKLTNNQNQKHPSINAAERRLNQILAKILAPSTTAFFQQMNFQGELLGLDLGCKTGENTEKIKATLGAGIQLYGWDENEMNVKIAKEKGEGNISYNSLGFDQLNATHQFDFIYSRLFVNHFRNPLKTLQQIHDNLKPGGYVMIEDLDFSQFQCFPNCYAFDRFVELYSTIKHQQNGINIKSDQLPSLLRQIGFKKVEVQVIMPRFLSGKNRHIPSLFLESLSQKQNNQKIFSPTEIQALLFELKDFEQQQNTMITLPGIYQIKACRS